MRNDRAETLGPGFDSRRLHENQASNHGQLRAAQRVRQPENARASQVRRKSASRILELLECGLRAADCGRHYRAERLRQAMDRRCALLDEAPTQGAAGASSAAGAGSRELTRPVWRKAHAVFEHAGRLFTVRRIAWVSVILGALAFSDCARRLALYEYERAALGEASR